jgi:hypothetical protein
VTLDYRRWIEEEAEQARREERREQEAKCSLLRNWEMVDEDGDTADDEAEE